MCCGAQELQSDNVIARVVHGWEKMLKLEFQKDRQTDRYMNQIIICDTWCMSPYRKKLTGSILGWNLPVWCLHALPVSA